MAKHGYIINIGGYFYKNIGERENYIKIMNILQKNLK